MGSNGMHRQTSLTSLGEYITHSALKLETAVEDRIGTQNQADIRRLGFIEMWIHSLAHDADDDATITQYGTAASATMPVVATTVKGSEHPWHHQHAMPL